MVSESEMPRPEWAPKVLELLQTQGKTQTWLAAMVGVQRSTMTRMLNGERSVSDEQMAKIAHALGVPTHWLESKEAA